MSKSDISSYLYQLWRYSQIGPLTPLPIVYPFKLNTGTIYSPPRMNNSEAFS